MCGVRWQPLTLARRRVSGVWRERAQGVVHTQGPRKGLVSLALLPPAKVSPHHFLSLNRLPLPPIHLPTFYSFLKAQFHRGLWHPVP